MTERLAGQSQRRPVTEVLGLQARQRVEDAGPGEGLPRGADRLGQRCFRQVRSTG
ncbi:hypothetical protein MAHJHV57_52030 [Mycobacterium avium subsp. hominissuis]